MLLVRFFCALSSMTEEREVDAESLLQKLEHFRDTFEERFHHPMSCETKREFDAIMAFARKLIAGKAKTQAASE